MKGKIILGWPNKPIIYEINTWVWLQKLSRAHNKPITLANIPDEIIQDLAALGVHAIWLMGVWERSAAAIMNARKYANQYKSALPDLIDDDIVGSPYAVKTYRVDENLGGRSGLATFRQRLQGHGLRLILDYVPNHVAIDHPWTRIHPDFLVLGTPNDIAKRADSFFQARDAVGRTIIVAHGRDPYFPGWSDTAQVNAFKPEFREAALETLLDIASQCDGVRCDMAMLMLNDVFSQTWDGYIDEQPSTDFWPEIIPQVKSNYPDFLFMAEVYWSLEQKLQQQGFDLTYDKLLYDRILEGNVSGIRSHLLGDPTYQKHLVRFVENHDEERAAESLGMRKSVSAAVLICTLPGATLLHDGQFYGYRVKLPVQLGRQPYEPTDERLREFYKKLLSELRAPLYQTDAWQLLDVLPTREKDAAHDRLLAYGWHAEDDYRLIIVNLSDQQAQGMAQLQPWPGLSGHRWQLRDMLNGESHQHAGQDILDEGLYVNLDPYSAHLIRFEPA